MLTNPPRIRPALAKGERADIGLDCWVLATKFDPVASRLADGHYSRRKVGSPQFMPPGQTICLLSRDHRAIFGWWRPHPASGLASMNGLDGWTCTIFRNDRSSWLSSAMIVDAERSIAILGYGVGPDGLLSYVWPAKVRSANPGFCFKRAGYQLHPRKPLSADGRKLLFWKPHPPRPED